MAQKLKVLHTLAQKQSLVPSTYAQWLTSPKNVMPFSGLQGQLHTCIYVHTYTHKSLNVSRVFSTYTLLFCIEIILVIAVTLSGLGEIKTDKTELQTSQTFDSTGKKGPLEDG